VPVFTEESAQFLGPVRVPDKTLLRCPAARKRDGALVEVDQRRPPSFRIRNTRDGALAAKRIQHVIAKFRTCQNASAGQCFRHRCDMITIIGPPPRQCAIQNACFGHLCRSRAR
jgi:hypothetical protein